MPHWYAVHCKPRQDSRAEENLCNQGYEVFRPLARVRRAGPKGMAKIIESFFPRYLFIRLDEGNQNWAPIRSTRGVASLVRFSEKPAPVSDHIVETIREFLTEDGCADLTSPRFQQDCPVRITSGPFRGCEGRFFSSEANDRVVVLLSVMQQQQRLLLPEHVIEAA